MLIAGARAIFEDDIKKIVALSTLRQLGVIIIVLSVHKPILAYYHLILHAYFKAILFMCAGYTIHLIKDYQDIRTMGMGEARMPFIFRIVLVCNISLCGLPFMRGFYSKDIILEYIFIQSNRLFFIFLIAVATILTMAYSVRLSLILGSNSTMSEPIVPTNYIDLYMFGGVGILYFFSVCGGYMVR
jgi:NADH-ubiquinone oxidoreductase chain 5